MKKAIAGIVVLLALTGATAFSGSRQIAPLPAKASSKPHRVTSIASFPNELKLCVQQEHQLLISAALADNLEQDVTARAEFKSNQPKIAEVTRAGLVRALKPGSANIRVKAAGRSSSVHVEVDTGPTELGVTFLNDVLPVLSKAGCNSGSCHAKAEGQNGFKLSVFAYDPKSDYRQI